METRIQLLWAALSERWAGVILRIGAPIVGVLCVCMFVILACHSTLRSKKKRGIVTFGAVESDADLLFTLFSLFDTFAEGGRDS